MQNKLATRMMSLTLCLLTLTAQLPVSAAAVQMQTPTQADYTALRAADSSAETAVLLDENASWAYLDDRTDPAGDAAQPAYNRISWTAGNYDDSQWKKATGSFGSKKGSATLETGYTASTLLEGCDGKNDTEAYFFRSTFHITQDQLKNFAQLRGSYQADDCAIVYINGRKVSSVSEPEEGVTANLQYAGVSAGTPVTGTITLNDLSLLSAGENTIAVELHQDRITSSDIWFHLTDLSLSNDSALLEQNAVNLSLGRDHTEINFAWYSNASTSGALLLAEQTDLVSGEMPENARRIEAQSQASNRDTFHAHKATATGLAPATTYAYQLINGNMRAAVQTFTTGSAHDFSFAFAGDPQIGSGNAATDTLGWGNTLQLVSNSGQFSGVDFLLSAGDQVNTASDENEYNGYLEHDALKSLPMVTTIGNHDSRSNAYQQHFNVANESSTHGVTTAGGDSYFVYNGVLFMVLNSNNRSNAEHKAFMEEAIKATENQNISWKVVEFHHSIFSVASHAEDGDILDRRSALAPIFKELDIDVVLMGHDHVYVRTYMMDGLTPMKDAALYDDAQYGSITDPEGILYVTANSASGSKYYTIKSTPYEYSAVQNQERVPNISRVDVSDAAFTITTYRTSDMSVVDTFTINRTTTAPQHLLINHIYGAGAADQDGTPIQNSFVELYNPTAAPIELSDYVLSVENSGSSFADDFTVTLPAFSLQPGQSYLVTGKAYTEAPATSYQLPQADFESNDLLIDNKSYTASLKTSNGVVDQLTASKDTLKVSKQKSARRVQFADTDSPADFETISWKQGEMTADKNTLKLYAPKNSAGHYGRLTYTPVQTTDDAYTGFVSGNGKLNMKQIGRYNAGAMNADGGSTEIVAYGSGYAYTVNGIKGTVDIVPVSANMQLTATEIDLEALVASDDFTYGDMTSLALSPDAKQLAVSIQEKDFTKNGMVAIFRVNGDQLTDPVLVRTGVQPDMVTYTPDGQHILTANEGEPHNGYGDGAVDPAGTVTIIRTSDFSVKTAGFDAFTAEALTQKNVLLSTVNGQTISPALDLEPEYIAAGNQTAYVSLQENNAIAVLDLTSGSFTAVHSAGYQDFSKAENAVDLVADGAYAPATYELLGARMPDGISLYEVDGKTYLLTANEGDAREWGNYSNETAKQTVGTLNGKDVQLKLLDPTAVDGLPNQKVAFGGRSFTMFEVTEAGLNEVFDSANGFESLTAKYIPDYFNSSNDDREIDSRSAKKGPEPETITVGKVNDRTYAFIALERIGGIMAYDITAPKNAVFANYINSRDFSADIKNDVSPEGMFFVPASDSTTGKALLLAACEASGTLAVYELEIPRASSGGGNGGGSTSPADLTPSVSSDGHGAITVTPQKPTQGTKVTVTTKPDAGYTLTSLSAVDATGKAVTLTDLGGGQYSFTQPAGKVSLRAVFAKSADHPSSVFTDVDAAAWYRNAVDYVLANKLMTGYSTTLFAPNDSLTRSMICQILYNAKGRPAASPGNAYSDVPADTWYTAAVLWATEGGIASGYGDGCFGPSDSITREQLAAVLYRYAGSPAAKNGSSLSAFSDQKDVSAWAEPAIVWAVSEGILSGKGNGLLDAKGTATRAEASQMLMRFLSKS